MAELGLPMPAAVTVTRGPRRESVASSSVSTPDGIPNRHHNIWRPKHPQDWENIKPLFKEFYVDLEFSLEQVSERLREETGFSATIDQYKKKVKEWGFQKRITAREKKHMIEIEDARRNGNPPKETVFRIRNREVNPALLERYRKEHRRLLERLNILSCGLASDFGDLFDYDLYYRDKQVQDGNLDVSADSPTSQSFPEQLSRPLWHEGYP
ncbi:hypothetical protein MMC10_003569 [Thelotrema lepadinum]|nr:hypothetical protein [Thelotrema lepadinum]